MVLTESSDLAALLSSAKTIAVEIASPKEERTSNRIMRFLIEKGYEVYPINPGFAGQEIAGRLTYASLKDVPVPIDIVDIFRKSEAIGPIVDQAIEIGAKSIWMQLGIVNDEAAEKAEKAGLDVVMDRCTAIELRKMNE